MLLTTRPRPEETYLPADATSPIAVPASARPFEAPSSPDELLLPLEMIAMPRLEADLDGDAARPDLPMPLGPEEPTRDERRPRAFEFEHLLSVADGDLLRAFDTDVTDALAGRGEQQRSILGAREGATLESERAVVFGLNWLAAHQCKNGSWHFNHKLAGCSSVCRNPGSHPSTTAATSLALLAFLGAGQTQQRGKYQEAVRAGFYYLCGRMFPTEHGGDFQEGTMYAQGMAAMCLAEGYAMTGDEQLGTHAQLALDFIIWAQDRKGGGWRYAPLMPGDTTVTGWQLMALKCGQMASLRVPQESIYLVQRYLDSVQDYAGAKYLYHVRAKPSSDATNSAVGLLCRMYTGWNHETPALERGVGLLAHEGPSADNMFYNYYATQVLRHWGGDVWRTWNEKLREHLIKTQATEGHESGSWYFDGGQAEVGGRLYNTALALLTLEVYYRYLPLDREAAEGGAGNRLSE